MSAFLYKKDIGVDADYPRQNDSCFHNYWFRFHRCPGVAGQVAAQSPVGEAVRLGRSAHRRRAFPDLGSIATARPQLRCALRAYTHIILKYFVPNLRTAWALRTCVKKWKLVKKCVEMRSLRVLFEQSRISGDTDCYTCQHPIHGAGSVMFSWRPPVCACVRT